MPGDHETLCTHLHTLTNSRAQESKEFSNRMTKISPHESAEEEGVGYKTV